MARRHLVNAPNTPYNHIHLTRGTFPMSGRPPRGAFQSLESGDGGEGAAIVSRGGSTGKRKAGPMALPQFTMRQLLEAGVHFGHQTHRWNPKMGNYLYG